MNPSLRRFAVPMAFIIALGLTAPTAGFAATERSGLHWPDWLGFLSHLWAPQRCTVDPVGRCIDTSAPAPRDQGTNASAPAPRDEGCMVEPVGRCGN
jgi:hypothetical protein